MSEIRLWMECNILKLDEDKTYNIVSKSEHSINSFDRMDVQFRGALMGVN